MHCVIDVVLVVYAELSIAIIAPRRFLYLNISRRKFTKPRFEAEHELSWRWMDGLRSHCSIWYMWDCRNECDAVWHVNSKSQLELYLLLTVVPSSLPPPINLNLCCMCAGLEMNRILLGWWLNRRIWRWKKLTLCSKPKWKMSVYLRTIVPMFHVRIAPYLSCCCVCIACHQLPAFDYHFRGRAIPTAFYNVFTVRVLGSIIYLEKKLDAIIPNYTVKQHKKVKKPVNKGKSFFHSTEQKTGYDTCTACVCIPNVVLLVGRSHVCSFCFLTA